MSKSFAAVIAYSVEKGNYWQYNFQFFITTGFAFYTVRVWFNMTQRIILNELAEITDFFLVCVCDYCPEDLLQGTVTQAGPNLGKNVEKTLQKCSLIRDSHQRDVPTGID